MEMRDIAIMSADTPRTPGWLRLVIVSDTHNVDLPISLCPEGDLLIHAGDHTKNGLFSELTDAATWLRSLAARYTYGVVSIAGNHVMTSHWTWRHGYKLHPFRTQKNDGAVS